MNEVMNKIEEIESMLEPEIEWPMTEQVDKYIVKSCLQNIYGYLDQLKKLAEDMK